MFRVPYAWPSAQAFLIAIFFSCLWASCDLGKVTVNTQSLRPYEDDVVNEFEVIS
jgi:hypothetical protein